VRGIRLANAARVGPRGDPRLAHNPLAPATRDAPIGAALASIGRRSFLSPFHFGMSHAEYYGTHG
jgi:hypothetical protein